MAGIGGNNGQRRTVKAINAHHVQFRVHRAIGGFRRDRITVAVAFAPVDACLDRSPSCAKAARDERSRRLDDRLRNAVKQRNHYLPHAFRGFLVKCCKRP